MAGTKTKKYKSVWISKAEYGRYLVNTKVGTKYIAWPPDALQNAITKAREIRNGCAPILLISFPGGKYQAEVVG